MPKKSPTTRIETHPLTPDRWHDFAALMNSRADVRHCWCMWPRLATNYKLRSGATNRRSIKKVVDTAPAPPGVLAYIDGNPAGWCAIGPRSDFPRMDLSNATAALDAQPVWTVACFFVPRRMRSLGVSRALLGAAITLAAHHGARIIEACPVEGRWNRNCGVASVFAAAGFEEVARRLHNRPIMRLQTKPASKSRRRLPATSA